MVREEHSVPLRIPILWSNISLNANTSNLPCPLHPLTHTIAHPLFYPCSIMDFSLLFHIILLPKNKKVTGAASGIGRAAALRLANKGAAVVAVDRDWDGKDIGAAEAGGSSPLITQVAADVADVTAVHAIFDAAASTGVSSSVDEGGEAVPTVLVNAAGITRDGWMWKLDDAAWDDVIDVNLKGPWLLKREFAKRILVRRCYFLLLPPPSFFLYLCCTAAPRCTEHVGLLLLHC